MLPRPRVNIGTSQDLRRYILPTETVVLATRRHWAALLEPAATTVGVFLLVAIIVFVTPPTLQDVVGWLWFGWLFTLGRFAFRWLEWRHEWFISTDKRLLLLYGLVIHKVAMMPLMKVTDMGYSRTPLGQLLGYGRFVMESAGQDQALRQIDYVPHPDATYRTLCAEIFRPTGAKPASDAVPASGQAPVVVVPGRPDDEARPTTQPIAVPGRPGRTTTPPSLPPTVTPGAGATAGRADTPAPRPAGGDPADVWPPLDVDSSAPRADTPASRRARQDSTGAPRWHRSQDWERPEPYDPNPR